MRLLDSLAKRAGFVWTRDEAWDRFACARCGRPVHPSSHHDNLGTWTDIERDEYWISALCRWCQSDIEKMLPDE